MKKNLIAALCVLMAFAGCKPKAETTSADGTPPPPSYNPYVEAFTSGKVSRTTPVYLIFGQEIDSLKRTADLLKKSMEIKPAVSGSWDFDDARTLVFRPAGEFMRGTKYTVTANVGGFFDAEGADRRFSFGFETQPLALRADPPQVSTNADNDEKYDILVNLSSPDSESPETIESLITLSEKADVQWTHTSDGTTHSMMLTAVTAGKDPRNIVVSVGANKLGVPKEDLLTVYVPTAAEFGIYDVAYTAHPEKFIEVTFTKALDETQNMHGLAYIEGNSTETVTVEGNKLRLYPDNSRVGKVSVVLSANIRSNKGKTLGEEVTRVIEISSEVPAVRFVGEGVIIPQGVELAVPFQAVWLRGVTVSVTRIFEKNTGQFLQVNQLDGGYELSRVGRLVARKTVWLDENGGDLSAWKTYAVDLKQLIEVEQGAIYRVELDFRQDLSAYPCDGVVQKSKEQIMADDEVKFRQDVSRYDRSGGYYYYDDYYDYDDYDIDWSRYDWREREDPCAYSFYTSKKIARNILATNLGLVAKIGQQGEITAMVHNLLTVMPETGVTVEAFNYQGQSIGMSLTDSKGTVHFNTGNAKPYYIKASQGKQRTYLRVDPGRELSTSSFDVSGEAVRRGIKGFIYGDRGVWRPGDVMYLSFMLGDQAKSLPANVPVVMELYTPLDQLYLRKTQTRGEMGLYAFEMPTDADAQTGAWRADVQVGGVTFTKRIRVETIKPNRLKIEFGFGDRKVLLTGKPMTAEMHVEWLQGAIARNLSYETETTVNYGSTTFDKFANYVFTDPSKQFDGREYFNESGTTDEKGDAQVTMNFDMGESAPGMLSANFVTRVYEESGDFSIDGFSIPISPYERYVGVYTPQTSQTQLSTGRAHQFGVAMVDYTGKPLANQSVKVELFKVEWYWWWDSSGGSLVNYMSRQHLNPVKVETLKTGADGKATFSVTMTDEQWGTYFIRVRDLNGRHTAGVMSYFDWPNSWRRDSEGSDAATKLVFRTDKDTYAPGESMAVTLPSSQGARAIVSIENGTRVLSVGSHECTGGETTIHIPVFTDMQPNVYVNVTLLQPHGLTQNDVPIRMYGIVPVTVTSPQSHLKPVIKAPAEIRPEAKYELTVSEQDGRQMAYTLAIVDEGLLDLTRFKTPDPWEAFNAREALGVSTYDMYNYVLGAYGGRIEQMFSIGGGDEAMDGKKNTVNRFKPVVQFDGPFLLKKGEKRKHSYTMPNYNGRVRIMVVACDGEAYGSAQQTMMVRKPVMLLGTLPRVIGTGEEMDVPATVFATEDGVGDVKVTIACSDNMEIVGESTKTVNFKQMGDKTTVFRVRTKKNSGAGKVTLTASGKGDKSVYETDIEIRSVRRAQVKVTSAIVEAGKTWSENVPLPGADGTNSVTLEVSDIPPVNLSSRLGYLLGFPHGCLEQITSKAFPQLYIKQFVSLTKKQEAEADEAIKETIRRYKSYQTAEGAMAYWPGGTSTNAWGSVYGMHFLIEAEAKGYLVPDALKRTLINNLKLVARKWKGEPSSWYARSEQVTQAYRLYVLALAKSAETGAMNRLREEKSLSATARWMLAAAYAQSGRKDVANQMTSATVPMNDNYNAEYDLTYGSAVRDKAIKLIALVMLDRAQDAANLCREISGDLSSDNWYSTQSTAYALMAISRYVGKYAVDETLKFSYDALGQNGSINSQKHIWSATLAEKAKAGSVAAKVENTGKSTIFVRVITEGTPDQGNETAYANGVTVEVEYAGSGGGLANVASLEKGDNLSSVVTVRNPTPRIMRNLVLTQIFPSGWEILSTRFLDETGDDTAAGVNYQDIRDDRVYSYIDYLPAGRSVTVHLNLAAIYGGHFYLPPVWCEAMYDNTTRANTEGMQVEVR